MDFVIDVTLPICPSLVSLPGDAMTRTSDGNHLRSFPPPPTVQHILGEYRTMRRRRRRSRRKRHWEGRESGAAGAAKAKRHRKLENCGVDKTLYCMGYWLAVDLGGIPAAHGSNTAPRLLRAGSFGDPGVGVPAGHCAMPQQISLHAAWQRPRPVQPKQCAMECQEWDAWCKRGQGEGGMDWGIRKIPEPHWGFTFCTRMPSPSLLLFRHKYMMATHLRNTHCCGAVLVIVFPGKSFLNACPASTLARGGGGPPTPLCNACNGVGRPGAPGRTGRTGRTGPPALTGPICKTYRSPGARKGRMGLAVGPAFQRLSGMTLSPILGVRISLSRRDANRRARAPGPQMIWMAPGSSLAFQRLSRDTPNFIPSVRLLGVANPQESGTDFVTDSQGVPDDVRGLPGGEGPGGFLAVQGIPALGTVMAHKYGQQYSFDSFPLRGLGQLWPGPANVLKGLQLFRHFHHSPIILGSHGAIGHSLTSLNSGFCNSWHKLPISASE
eukprot:gene25018-biopygen23956